MCLRLPFPAKTGRPSTTCGCLEASALPSVFLYSQLADTIFETKQWRWKYFNNRYGSHLDDYPTAYMTAAAGIGMVKSEVDIFLERLDKTIVEFKKKCKKSAKASSAASAGGGATTAAKSSESSSGGGGGGGGNDVPAVANP